jgi:nicotinamide-nucleotide amidase
MIVVTGGELLEGAYADGHTAFLTRTLRPLGCRCVGSMTVDDNRLDIEQALRFATNRAPLVLVTGGLGPTPNDITRETLSDFTGMPLEEHPDVIAEMERRFQTPRDQLRANLRRQTKVPVGGGYLKNSNGSAVGLVFDSGTSVVVALPGPPRETQPMVRDELLPYLRKRFGVRPLGASLTLRFVGIGQSLIDQTLKERVRPPPDLTITSIFEASRVDFTFSLAGSTPEEWARLRRLEERMREELGEHIYADDGSSLEQVVVKQFLGRGGQLALVEVASGGHFAAAITGAAGAADLLAGMYAAPSVKGAARLLGLKPEQLPASGIETAKALASAAAERAESAWAIAIGPVESSPDRSGAAWLALRYPEGRWQTLRLPVRDSWESTHSNLTTQVLDFLRRRLASPPGPDVTP